MLSIFCAAILISLFLFITGFNLTIVHKFGFNVIYKIFILFL